MPDATTADAPAAEAASKLHWATKARLAREAAARGEAASPVTDLTITPSVEAPPAPPAPSASEPASLSWEEFERVYPWPEFVMDVLRNGLSDRAAFMVANWGEDKGNGLCGRIRVLYRVCYLCMLHGPDPVSPGGGDLSAD